MTLLPILYKLCKSKNIWFELSLRDFTLRKHSSRSSSQQCYWTRIISTHKTKQKQTFVRVSILTCSTWRFTLTSLILSRYLWRLKWSQSNLISIAVTFSCWIGGCIRPNIMSSIPFTPTFTSTTIFLGLGLGSGIKWKRTKVWGTSFESFSTWISVRRFWFREIHVEQCWVDERWFAQGRRYRSRRECHVIRNSAGWAFYQVNFNDVDCKQ